MSTPTSTPQTTHTHLGSKVSPPPPPPPPPQTTDTRTWGAGYPPSGQPSTRPLPFDSMVYSCSKPNRGASLITCVGVSGCAGECEQDTVQGQGQPPVRQGRLEAVDTHRVFIASALLPYSCCPPQFHSGKHRAATLGMHTPHTQLCVCLPAAPPHKTSPPIPPYLPTPPFSHLLVDQCCQLCAGVGGVGLAVGGQHLTHDQQVGGTADGVGHNTHRPVCG